MSKSVAERLWSKVIRSGECWVYMGCANTKGYGQITVRVAGQTKAVMTHRLVWQMFYGAIPRGLMVLHTCDVKPCLRPSHLYLGTASENAKDAVRRNGMNQGTRCATAKLDASTVRFIRTTYDAGLASYPQLARRYGVAVSTIRHAAMGLTWKHVPKAH